MGNAEQIRELTQNIRLPVPDTSESKLMWYLPDQASRNYFRVVPMDDDAPERLYMDVWVDAKFTIDRTGVYHLHVEAVLYNGLFDMREDETEIASLHFSDTEQPTMQTVLNNWEIAYMKRAKEAVARYTDWAEAELLGELEEQNIA